MNTEKAISLLQLVLDVCQRNADEPGWRGMSSAVRTCLHYLDDRSEPCSDAETEELFWFVDRNT